MAFVIVLPAILPGTARAAAGPVAAYSFDEGSGVTAGDTTGNGHAGAILGGATWMPGHTGSALLFNGTDASVALGSLGTFYQQGFTLEAWVQKTSANRNDVAVVGTWDGDGPMIWVDHLATRYHLTLGNSLSTYLDSGQNPVAGQWQYLSATYDGTTARFYIDGTQVASSTFTGNVGSSNVWRIGAYRGSPAGFFDGLIDDVRIYDRALSATDVQSDMSQPVAPDTSPPSAPTNLTATGSIGRVSLNWGAATDNVAVDHYNVYRSTSSGFTPSPANRVAQPTGTSYVDNGLAAGTYYYRVTAEDHAGNVGPPTDEASATALPDAAPAVSITSPSGGTVNGVVTLTASASDDVSVAGVQFKVDGQNVGAEVTGSPYTLPWDTRGELNDQHTLTAVARDNAGHSTTSSPVVVTVFNTGVSTTGLVASYTLDEGAGTVAHDSSGGNRNGTLNSASWTSTGRFGGALSLDGNTGEVDLPALGTFYKTGFTYEAWVRKQTAKADVAILGTWTSSGGGPMLWVDYSAGRYELTLGGNSSNYLDSGRTPTIGQWQHVAATYDGTTARIFVDGVQTASSTFTGNVGDSNVWRIGAYRDTPFGFFDGDIDNVRVYNRALSASEVQTDMASRIPVTDTTPPSAPGNLTATGAIGKATLSWTPATDNQGVTMYNVHRSTTSGFTPNSSNRIAQTATTGYVDTGLSSGIYYYKVTAQDAAQNVGPPSNQAFAVVQSDTTLPTVSITSPTGGTVSGVVTVSANANDNVGVAGVQFKRDGVALGAEDTTAPYSISWDTRGETNDPHTLTAVARDGAGNSRTSAAIALTIANPGVPNTGLRAAYGFDDGSGTIARDSSGNNRTGTLIGGTSWTTGGRFASALTFDGVSGDVDLPALGTFYKTGFTLEAWIRRPSVKTDVGIVGTWNGGSGGPMLWVDYAAGRYELTLGGSSSNYLDSGTTPPVGQWQHVAATYDGATARMYVDGVEVGSQAFTGNVGDSNTWRIGAYRDPASGFFQGQIDNVRIYDRPLTPAEVQTDMNLRVQPDRTPPQVTASSPSAGATGVSVGTSVTATFNEPMDPATAANGIELRNSSNQLVSATVTYDSGSQVATLTPQAALQFGAQYTVTVPTNRMRDLAGNGLASNVTWTFTTEPTPPQILVVKAASNPFASYLTEILRNEGVDAFTTIDVSFLSTSLLNRFDVVLLGETPLSSSQVTSLTNWVNQGGNLVAMRPAPQLASLLGLTSASGTLANAYLKVNTAQPPGQGIVSETIQFHGTADKYTLNGASAVATLFSDANTQTPNPAVTLRSVGGNGGQAAAFSYDLARSVVYTRQGNPAWVDQERDGVLGIRPDDLFYGAKVGDVQPDWVNTSKIAIPQADEQQRLLVNMITLMERDRLPLPHFWYLPRGLKAAVVMSGDDHANGGTAAVFDHFNALSPPGCNVANWECVRSTSYIYPEGPITDAQAASYTAQGFEVSLHPHSPGGGCDATPATMAQLSSWFDTQLSQFTTKFTSIPAPATDRIHCVEWPGWATAAKVELAHGMRLDANYYHFPDTWLADKPGFLNGGGFPMRFADTDGSTIDVYQQNTNMTDETGQQYPQTLDTLLDNALGSQGYYGAFGANLHTDEPPQPDVDAVVESAQSRGVPVVSFKQLLTWVDGRNSSTIRGMSWSSNVMTFTTTVGSGANGLQTMLPTLGRTRTLSALTCGGSTMPYTLTTIKGVQYAMFTTVNGTCRATYS